MNNNLENGTLTIFAEGRIDSNNAELVGNQIQAVREANEHDRLVLDFEDVEYISSAGLRQILKLKKSEKDFSIVNASAEIYDIFDMTGFTEMMDIQKAYRKFSVDGCEVIGEGSNGIVYRINPDTIIKVYKNPDAIEDIKKERELARKALVMGINTAIPYDVVKVGDKYGSVFELLSSKSITKLIKSDPENTDKYIKVFADMLKEIHSTPVKPGTLPNAEDTVIGWVKWLEGKIPADTYAKLEELVNGIPHMDFMLHGDYHTNNLHYANDEAILIDMDTLAVGHPVIEWGSVYLAFKGYAEVNPDNIRNFMKLEPEEGAYIFDKTMEYYFEGKTDEEKADILNKLKVVAYTRSTRRTMKREPDNIKDIEYYKEKLIEAVSKVDTLVF